MDLTDLHHIPMLLYLHHFFCFGWVLFKEEYIYKYKLHSHYTHDIPEIAFSNLQKRLWIIIIKKIDEYYVLQLGSALLTQRGKPLDRSFYFLSFINYFHIYPKHAMLPNLNFSAVAFDVQYQILTMTSNNQPTNFTT